MRHKRACLQNDFNAVLREIEENLHKLHATFGDEPETNQEVKKIESKVEKLTVKEPVESEKGIWISDVLDDSPASQAGFQIGERTWCVAQINAGSRDRNNAKNNTCLETLRFARVKTWIGTWNKNLTNDCAVI